MNPINDPTVNSSDNDGRIATTVLKLSSIDEAIRGMARGILKSHPDWPDLDSDDLESAQCKLMDDAHELGIVLSAEAACHYLIEAITEDD